MRVIVILLIALCIKMFSCTPCSCTLILCECQGIFISIEANAENNMEGSFTGQEMNEFYLIRSNVSYDIIDSVKMEFQNQVGNTDYNRYFEINENTFTDNGNLSQFNYLIKNLMLKSIDTISSISYSEQMERRICNKCSGCDDQYISCLEYSDLNLKFNDINQDIFKIKISK